MDKATIGSKIRIVREHMGLTQDEFGHRIGAAKQTISGWENGQSLPDIITLCDIAEMCGLTLNDFVEISNNDSFPATEFSDKERCTIERLRAAQPNIRSAIEVLLGIKK
ncbi:MAG: helix-turn-helix transcriptional regulator [Acidaminococcaceae bacterium]|nr:helix-turn-helix transcriptional regulator [Acidaminococcaceae bacterium]